MNIKFNQRNLKIAIAASVLVGSAGLTVPAYANSTSTSSMNVSSNIGMNCTISTTDIAFGAYDPIVTNASLDLDAQGSVTTTCTVGSAGKVIIGQGSGPDSGSSNAAPLRRMTGPSDGDYLKYQVYSNLGRSAVWTNEVASGVPYTANGSAEVMPVYGRVEAGQNTVAKGSYSDILLVTVNY